METTLVSQSLDRVEADAVVVLLFEEETAPAELKSFSPWLDELRASVEFTGKTGELAVLVYHEEAHRLRRAGTSAGRAGRAGGTGALAEGGWEVDGG